MSWLITQQVDALAATGSIQMCIVAADVPVDLASPGIKRQVKHTVPLQLQGEVGQKYMYRQTDTYTEGPRAVFRARTGLWQGESRTRIWYRGWYSRRQ